jgi:hypothetical protein
MKTLKILEATHTELTKVKGALIAKTGNPDVTYDDTILALVQAWNGAKKSS